jgi:hypothetical protein
MLPGSARLRLLLPLLLPNIVFPSNLLPLTPKKLRLAMHLLVPELLRAREQLLGHVIVLAQGMR